MPQAEFAKSAEMFPPAVWGFYLCVLTIIQALRGSARLSRPAETVPSLCSRPVTKRFTVSCSVGFMRGRSQSVYSNHLSERMCCSVIRRSRAGEALYDSSKNISGEVAGGGGDGVTVGALHPLSIKAVSFRFSLSLAACQYEWRSFMVVLGCRHQR